MAILHPIKALRPAPDRASRVASPPYDVVNEEEVRRIVKDNPLSYLRVTRAETDLPEGVDPYDRAVYEKAKTNLDELRADGTLIEDETPSVYLYQLERLGRAQTGIFAAFSVDDYDNDVILKHEKTRRKKEDDRTNHILTTNAQTGAVFLTYRAIAEIDEAVERIVSEKPPLYDFVAEDGVAHRLWRVEHGLTQRFVSALGGAEKLYVADGHHRIASASRARAARRKENPGHNGSEEYNYLLAALFPADQLEILPYNRVARDLGGMSASEFLDRVAEDFDVASCEEKAPKRHGTICLYLEGEWRRITLKESQTENGVPKDAKGVGDRLDVATLQRRVLDPILGITDPRADERIDFVGGVKGTDELERLVDSGDYAVAFSMYPVAVEELMAVSDAGEMMPPKSTWFEPKLRDGLLTHRI
ncbi:MAG: DUF1015 family protein [Ignavibacteriales bacterium]|nr:DUF1015 family protein [Ignavibacteriales bacterium]